MRLSWLWAAALALVSMNVLAGFEEGKAAMARRDYETALREYQAAAKQGDAEAQAALGFLYQMGLGVQKDLAEAARWYRKAAEQGNVKAQYYLGFMYEHGLGVPEDDAVAVYWYLKAAKRGDSSSQVALGDHYATGEGVPKDGAKAVHWYRKAAGRGDAIASWALGQLYDRGQGVPEDDAEAVYWYRKAAEEGFPPAQTQLGAMYFDGAGVPQDYVRAYAWFSLAAASRDEEGGALKRFTASLMTSTQIAEAEALSRQLAEQIAAQTKGRAWGVPFTITTPPPSSEQIRHVQEMLEDLGYDPGPVDGVAGARTLAAIRQYQANINLPPTGKITPELVRLLEVAVAVKRAAEQNEVEPRGAVSGTSFLVDERGDVVTNAHVVSKCSRLAVESGGKQLTAVLVATDSANDLALLSVRHLQGNPATLRSLPKAKLGERVVVAGYPLRGLVGGDLQVGNGVVSGLEGPSNDRRLMQVTAPVQAGNSGGPLLDAGGLVAGVVVSKLDAAKVYRLIGDVPQNVSFAIEAAVLRTFLDLQGVAYESAAQRPEQPVAALAQAARNFVFPVVCWK